MDPTTNPTPNPNPTPAPAAPAAPAPAAPAGPAPAAAPSPTPATAASGMTTPPVNPVINPVVSPSGAPAPVGNPAMQSEGLAATDPIMMPEPAPAPDPVEEELKAPMKAAEPVPGSIGSAVSGPAAGAAAEPAPAANPFVSNDKQTPNVAFNDPATQPDVANGAPMAPAKKKTNKTTLIALIIVAAMIVIALGAVLAIQLLGDQGGSSGGSTPNTQVTIDENTSSNATDEMEDEKIVDTTSGAISCTRNMTTAEIAKLNDAASGTISVSAEFDDDNMLTKIVLTEMVTYTDEDAVSNEPVENAVHEALADELTPESADVYFLPTDSTGALDLSKSSIQANYESLDFVCEVL